jgi:hypothetical protein
VQRLEDRDRIVVKAIDQRFFLEDGPGRVARLAVGNGAGGERPLDDRGIDPLDGDGRRAREGRQREPGDEQRRGPTTTQARQPAQGP